MKDARVRLQPTTRETVSILETGRMAAKTDYNVQLELGAGLEGIAMFALVA